MELCENKIQQSLWDNYTVTERLEFEALQAAEDYELRNLVKKVTTHMEPRPVPFSPAESYANALAHNDRLARLVNYAKGAPFSGQLGYLTHEQIAKDLARLMLT